MWNDVRAWLFPVWCIGCGADEIALCPACAPAPADAIVTVVAYTGVMAVAAYDGVLRRAIVAMKRGERAYLDPLARLLADTLTSDVPLIPLPTSRRRRAARGFDQAVELARRAARRHGVACYEVLEKRGAAQRGLGRLARLQANGRFALIREVPLPARAIVVDDVCTTGATLADGIATLGAAGVAVVGAAVLAHANCGRNSGATPAVMPNGQCRP